MFMIDSQDQDDLIVDQFGRKVITLMQYMSLMP